MRRLDRERFTGIVNRAASGGRWCVGRLWCGLVGSVGFLPRDASDEISCSSTFVAAMGVSAPIEVDENDVATDGDPTERSPQLVAVSPLIATSAIVPIYTFRAGSRHRCFEVTGLILR